VKGTVRGTWWPGVWQNLLPYYKASSRRISPSWETEVTQNCGWFYCRGNWHRFVVLLTGIWPTDIELTVMRTDTDKLTFVQLALVLMSCWHWLYCHVVFAAITTDTGLTTTLTRSETFLVLRQCGDKVDRISEVPVSWVRGRLPTYDLETQTQVAMCIFQTRSLCPCELHWRPRNVNSAVTTAAMLTTRHKDDVDRRQKCGNIQTSHCECLRHDKEQIYCFVFL
jgi:hypothetical protein